MHASNYQQSDIYLSLSELPYLWTAAITASSSADHIGMRPGFQSSNCFNYHTDAVARESFRHFASDV